MQKCCQACGMPLNKKEDFAKQDETSNFCTYCTKEDGTPKTCEEIFEGGVQFCMSKTRGDRNLAEKITRKNMCNQPYWKDKNCPVLQGEMATDEECAACMNKMM